MAALGSNDVKIFSSVRPLQIQRSFESSTDEETSQGSASSNHHSPNLSRHHSNDPAMSQNAVTISTSSGVQNTTPATLQQTDQQNTSPADTSSGQAKVLINTGSSNRPTNQSPIVISAGSSGQNRVVISSSGTGAIPTSQTVQATSPVPQAQPSPRRASLTIKTAPIAPQTTPASYPVSIPNPPTPTVVAQLAEAAADVDDSQHFYVEEIEHSASVSVSQRYTWNDLLENIDFDVIMNWVMAIIVSTVVCILSEDEISFVYILAFISIASIAAFIREEM
jgi:cobalamin biosynthesis Mg chelatase CobN